MKNKEWHSATAGTSYVRCPFFKAHENQAIICEGSIDGSNCAQRFKSRDDKEFHKRTYCENQYRRCEHYLSVMHWKWSGDDE